MTSPKKIAANRANAEKSTGPRSPGGKRRSARNSRRHGLSVPIVADPSWSAAIEDLAREITGSEPCEVNLQLAKRVAAALLDLLRVRRARQHLVSDALANGEDFELPEEVVQRQRIIGVKLPQAMTKRILPSFPDKPTGTLKQVMIVAELRRKLEKLDRYERRALSRRKRAMRAYDANLRATLKGRESRYTVIKLGEEN